MESLGDHCVHTERLQATQRSRPVEIPGCDPEPVLSGTCDQGVIDRVVASVQAGGTRPDPHRGTAQSGRKVGGPGQTPWDAGGGLGGVAKQARIEGAHQAAALEGREECESFARQGQVKGVSELEIQVGAQPCALQQGNGRGQGRGVGELSTGDLVEGKRSAVQGHGAVMPEDQDAVSGTGDVELHSVVAAVRRGLDRLEGVLARFGHAAAVAVVLNGALLLLGLAVSTDAHAVEIVVRAAVAEDMRTISGTLEVRGDGLTLSDPLALLPLPQDDLTTFRTFPGAPETGAVQWLPVGDRTWSFVSVLPRRYGALGALPERGLWANGGWYPQPVEARGGLPVADWDVQVTLPPGAVGALGDTTGEGTLSWAGRGERVGLAVLVEGRLTSLGPPEARVILLEDRRSRALRDQELAAVFARANPEEGLSRVVVVEAPMFRRLVRSGPGLVFLSDRAFRLTRPLQRYHRVPVARGLLAATLPLEDPWLRSIAAEPLVRSYGALDGAGSPTAWLRFGRFIPWVDLVLSDGRTAFVGELFDEVHPSDPLRDDLTELYRAPTPAQVVSAWLDDLGGPGTASEVGRLVLLGESLGTALAATGLEPDLARAWADPLPDQDLSLSVQRAEVGWEVRVERDAEADAARQPVVVSVDGERQTWLTSPGPDEFTWTRDSRPTRVALDPDRHLAQRETAYDTWPARWTPTVAAAVYNVNLTQRSATGLAWLNLRRRYDTRNRFQGVAYTDERNLLGARVTYRRAFGPLKDRLFRTHGAWISLGGALLSEAFRPTRDGRVAVGGGVGYSWDTRVDWFFPTSGHRIWVSGDGGLVPGSGSWWGAVRGGGTWIWSPHPRHALAVRARVGAGTGAVEHRLFSLGGDSAMRGVPAGQVVGSNQAVGVVEWRWAPLRNWSVWLPTLWLTELQLAGGVEGGWVGGLVRDGDVSAPGEGAMALGCTAGLGIAGDWFGARPGLLTLTLARPLWAVGIPEAPQLQVYLRGTQAF